MAMNLSDPQPSRRVENRRNVLFLCPANSICSIMAEALLEHGGGDDFRAFSGGVEPKGEIDPIAVDFLKSHKLWRHDLRSKNCREFLAPDAPRMDFVISLGEQPPAGLPAAWPGQPRIIHWRISEPVLGASPTAKANSFRKTFSELENRIRLFVLVHRREAIRPAVTAA
jgi:arsenate reductase (thioredoxin)